MQQREFASEVSRREAVLASLSVVTSSEVERWFLRFLASQGGTTNEWDHRFVEFIACHQGAPLLAGDASGGVSFVFSPCDAEGFWVLEVEEVGRAKGFLTARDADRVLELVRLKGLIAG